MLRMSILGALVASLLLFASSAAGQDGSSLPIKYGATTLQGEGDSCPSDAQRDAVRAEIPGDILALIEDNVLPIIQGKWIYV